MCNGKVVCPLCDVDVLWWYRIGWVNAQVQQDIGPWYWAEYSTFSISDEAGDYRLTVAGYSGDAGDAMRGNTLANYNSNGKRFSTKDRDNDGSPNNCAVGAGGGWWYDACSRSRLTQNPLAIWTTNSVIADPAAAQTARMLVKIN